MPATDKPYSVSPVTSNYRARLFLEGREVPFISATIMCNPGSPQICNIDMVPHEKIKNIKPKTQVHIAVRDTLAFPDGRYYLAFEGEVSSRGYARSHDGRSFTVTAMDYSVYWDEAKAYYYNPNFILGKLGDVVSGGVSVATETQAAGAKSINTVSTFQSQMIKTMLSEPDLVAGVVKVLKTMGQGNKYLKAANDRLRIPDRIKLFSSGRLQQFLKQLNIEEFMAGFTGQQGGLVAIREMLLQVMQMFFHEFMSIPFPPYYADKKAVGGYVFIPDSYPIPPPKCNVVFPNNLIGFQFTEDFRAAPTRLGYQASLPEYIAGAIGVTKYPITFYPTSFFNYMYKGSKKSLGDQAGSLLDSSTILGNYSTAGYNDTRTGNTAFGNKLREMDFLTNEEAIRGIFYEQETFPPSITALAKNSSATARNAFVQSIGEYLFFKKRFGSRNGSATLRFSPFIVPGLNGVILDDSSAGQTIIAKFQSLTHVISNSSALTTIQLGYARDFDEVDELSGGTGDPPLPTWFDTAVFGTVNKALYDKETAALVKKKYITKQQGIDRSKAHKPLTYAALSKFYQSIIASDSITGSDFGSEKYPSTQGSVAAILAQYKAKAGNTVARDSYTSQFVRRPVPTIGQAMLFLGAAVNSKSTTLLNPDLDIPPEFASFKAIKGGKFDGTASLDAKVLQIRRAVIDSYILVLKRGVKEGFRG